MKKYTLFFTWQSDKISAKKIIFNKLKEIKDELEKEDICLILDQDARNRTGTDNIDQTVLAKIDECDIFVADITPVAKLPPRKDGAHVKLLPNANVMYEYGYAKGIGKMNRCILLANLAAGENKEDLPFDINHDTITDFKDQADLNGLKSWILNIIEKVDVERATAKNTIDASIHFSDSVDEITIQPQFVEYNYIPKSHLSKTTPNNEDVIIQTVVGNLTPLASVLQASMKCEAKADIIKPHNKTTYLYRCPIGFVISNDSDAPLQNCKSYIRCDNPEVHFYESNFKEYYPIPFPTVEDLFINDNEAYRQRAIINPHETLPIGDVFISVPHNLNEVVLDWHISSAQGESFGKLHVRVSPLIDYHTIENDTLVGQTKVEGKVIYD